MSNIEIIEKPIDGSSHLSYKSFKNIPNDLLINEDTPKDTSVYVAEFPKTVQFKLKKFHKPASPLFPSGGYTLWNPKDQSIYSCYLDAAMIHPKNKVKKRKNSKKNMFFE